MPEPFFIQTSHESLIMVSGSAPSYFGGRFKAAWIGLGIMLGALLLLGFLLVGLNFAIQIPKDTVLLASLTPKDAATLLDEEQRNVLAPIWKQALSGTSSWPVVLGAAPGEHGWQTFAIVPRWRDKTFLAPHIKAHAGLLSLVTMETTLPMGKETKYLQEIPGMRHPAVFWVNPLPLLEKNSSFSKETWKIEPFAAVLNNKKIQSSVSFRTNPESTHLVDADVAISGLNKLKTEEARRLLASVSFGDGSLADLLVEMTNVNLWTDNEGTIIKKEADFTQKMTTMQARLLLAGLGVVQKNDIQLPDGTIAKERLAIDIADDSLFKTYETDRFGTVDLQEDHVLLGDLSASSTASIDACLSRPVLRLSSMTVRRMITILTGKTIEHVPALQFGEEKNRLTICKE